MIELFEPFAFFFIVALALNLIGHGWLRILMTGGVRSDQEKDIIKDNTPLRPRRLRLAKKLTQEQLAVDADIDLTYVGGIERGRRNPSMLVMVRIAEAMDVDPRRLLDRI